jgi:hypothetical protein
MILNGYEPSQAIENLQALPGAKSNPINVEIYFSQYNSCLFPSPVENDFNHSQIAPSKANLSLIQSHIPIDILIRYVEALTKLQAPKESIKHILSFIEELDCDEYYDILLDVIEIYSEL